MIKYLICNLLVFYVVATLIEKISDLYQTSLNLLKIEKAIKLLIVKLKYLNKILSLEKSTQYVSRQEKKTTINNINYSHKNSTEKSNIYSKFFK